MLTANALEILEARYFRRDPEGRVAEDAEAMFHRVAGAVAAAEKKDRRHWEGLFYNMLQGLEFLPNSPTLMNAGLPEGQLSACFVLPIPDRLSGILNSLGNAAFIQESGGGTGFDFSDLRPEGSPTSSGQGRAAGPLGFIRIFDAATDEIRQSGRRRGANMGVLRADHPDILKFIHAKHKAHTLSNFNLSVAVPDHFMRAVQSQASWELVDPENGKAAGVVPAHEIWDAICREAWFSGDPGLLFADTINRENPLGALGRITATNPCGEVPLLPYESCNLGSVNLARMLRPGPEGAPELDWEKLARVTSLGIRFLDDVITANRYLMPETRKMARENRKVGLGVMGWAECLLRLGIPYASDRAVALAGRLMAFIRERSLLASGELAAARGVFPNWKRSRYFPDQPLRHATVNSIAPTGSISIIAGTTYSIEPLYALSYRRSGILDGVQQDVLEPVVREVLQQRGLWTEPVQQALRESGSLSGLAAVPSGVRELLRTAHEISWKDHLRHQQAFQQHTDNAVSKTINLPEHTPVETVSAIFETAWEMGLKGVTIYRDGSRPGQVLRHCQGEVVCTA